MNGSSQSLAPLFSYGTQRTVFGSGFSCSLDFAYLWQGAKRAVVRNDSEGGLPLWVSRCLLAPSLETPGSDAFLARDLPRLPAEHRKPAAPRVASGESSRMKTS